MKKTRDGDLVMDYEMLKQLHAEMKGELLDNILAYWEQHTVDRTYGGFIGEIDHQNRMVPEADKGGILHARILWTFSAAYRFAQNPAYKSLAYRAFTYLKEKFIDTAYGGMYWALDYKSAPSDRKKHLYAQSFAIYGLTEYYAAFEEEEALNMAKSIFKLIEEKGFDATHLGYEEAFSEQWTLEKDARLSEKDDNTPKSMNTHLHVLEAYTNLYRYCKPNSLNIRISQLLDVFLDRIIDAGQHTLINFFDSDWTPKSNITSFGHDIEASWLLTEASNVIETYHRKEELNIRMSAIAETVLTKGLDENGGVYNESLNEVIIDTDKDWWPQAEALVGFLNAYELTGDERFLSGVISVWEFIKTSFIDRNHGGWFEKVSATGVAYPLHKVREWKCPYHNSRAALEVMHRVTRLLELAPVHQGKD
ncbi:MAG: AGE family epimerase/isomerase [Bacteroidota bacterium]